MHDAYHITFKNILLLHTLQVSWYFNDIPHMYDNIITYLFVYIYVYVYCIFQILTKTNMTVAYISNSTITQ